MFGRKKSKKDKESDKGKQDKEPKKSGKEAKISKEAKVSKEAKLNKEAKKSKKETSGSKSETKGNRDVARGETELRNGYTRMPASDGHGKQLNGDRVHPSHEYPHLPPPGVQPAGGHGPKYSAQNLNLVKPMVTNQTKDKKKNGILTKKSKGEVEVKGYHDKGRVNQNNNPHNQVTFVGPDNKVHQSVVNVSRDTIPRASIDMTIPPPKYPGNTKPLFAVAKHSVPQQLESEQVKHVNIAQGRSTKHVTSINVNTKTQIQIDDPSQLPGHTKLERTGSALSGYSSGSSSRSNDPSEAARVYIGGGGGPDIKATGNRNQKQCICGASQPDPKESTKTLSTVVGQPVGRPALIRPFQSSAEKAVGKITAANIATHPKVLAEVNIPRSFVNGPTTSTVFDTRAQTREKENLGYSVGNKLANQPSQKAYSEEDEIKYAELLFHRPGAEQPTVTNNLSRQNSRNSKDFKEEKPKSILKPTKKKVEFNKDVDINLFSTLSRHESLESLSHDPRFPAGPWGVGLESMRGRYNHPPQLDDTDLLTLKRRRCIPTQWAANSTLAWRDHHRALALSRERLAYEAWHGSVRYKPMVRTVRQHPADWRPFPMW